MYKNRRITDRLIMYITIIIEIYYIFLIINKGQI
jgi:hypothetical protein